MAWASPDRMSCYDLGSAVWFPSTTPPDGRRPGPGPPSRPHPAPAAELLQSKGLRARSRSEADATAAPRSELLVGERQNALPGGDHRVLERGGLRQVIIGVEARRRDLGAIEIGIALAFREAPRCDERGARHLPAAGSESPEPEIWHRCRVRRAGIGPIRSRNPFDGCLERGCGRRKLAANRRKLRTRLLAELAIELLHFGDHGKSRLAAVTRSLAADQIVSLDSRRSLVNGDDARIAVVLRRAGLLDEAHAAMHLHARVGNLLRSPGTPALDERE